MSQSAALPGSNVSKVTIAESAWKLDQETFDLEVVVPPNTEASIWLPGSADSPIVVGSGKYRWTYPYAAPAAEER